MSIARKLAHTAGAVKGSATKAAGPRHGPPASAGRRLR